MRIKRIQQLRSSRRQIACEKCEKWRSFARSSVERHANIKINESQVFSMRNAFFVASRGQFISRVHVQLNINSLQNFGFSEHARKLPKALTRVITEIDVPIGKTARSQYVDFHTSCESPHKNRASHQKFQKFHRFSTSFPGSSLYLQRKDPGCGWSRDLGDKPKPQGGLLLDKILSTVQHILSRGGINVERDFHNGA